MEGNHFLKQFKAPLPCISQLSPQVSASYILAVILISVLSLVGFPVVQAVVQNPPQVPSIKFCISVLTFK